MTERLARIWCQISTPPSAASFFGGIQHARRVLKCEILPACRLELAMTAFHWSQNSKSRASRKNVAPPAGRIRRLGFVTLEPRMLLTAVEPLFADSAVVAPISQPTDENVPSTGPIDESVPPPVDEVPSDGTVNDGSSPSDIGEPITPSDELPNEESDTDDGVGGGGTIDDPVNEAPTLYNFDWSYSEGVYQFSGYVSDDVDPAGLYVYFGGLLSGTYCAVEAGGYFCFGITLDSPEGTISAVFMDDGGLWSNQEMISLY